MDDDEHGEGWQADVIYPPCAHNPNRCPTCDGTGDAPPLMKEALERVARDCRGVHPPTHFAIAEAIEAALNLHKDTGR
jgi:hypothetical protein